VCTIKNLPPGARTSWPVCALVLLSPTLPEIVKYD
jgi:hypothetical protein